MDTFAEYLAKIKDEQQRARTNEVLTWVADKFPGLSTRIAWNQPMFTHHDTFIIGFSVSKNHLAVSPEQAGMEKFAEDISKAGYSQSSMLFRIKWNEAVNYALLEQIISYNCTDKATCTTFWRK